MKARYIIFVIDGPNNPAGPNEIEQIDLFNEKLRTNGNWVSAAGIAGPGKALVIDNRDGRSQVKEGSLFETPEHYSGFWLIEVADDQEAKEIALAGSHACNRRVELRPYLR
ncbi:MAG: YciI family protein [Actinomycetota bacterium]